MLAKDKFLEKISLILLIANLFFSHNLFAENISEKLISYNDKLKNSSALFIQTNQNNIQEGIIFFGNKRIKINYLKPQKLTLILSENKGVYINHELKESQFFNTKKSYIKIFFDIFHSKKYTEKIKIESYQNKIEIIEKINLDNIIYNIKIIYENEPIKLRKLEIINDDETIRMGFFEHNLEQVFDKSFFSMIDPYLN